MRWRVAGSLEEVQQRVRWSGDGGAAAAALVQRWTAAAAGIRVERGGARRRRGMALVQWCTAAAAGIRAERGGGRIHAEDSSRGRKERWRGIGGIGGDFLQRGGSMDEIR
uniref:DUF834 domain-containing protein n=1 Tax=Oryza glumipatula TaxID=40148 RepID=A0A0E0A9Q6_9ORYZ